jgi:type III secretion protein T
MEQILQLSKGFDYFTLALIASLPRALAFFDSSQIINSSIIPGAPRMAAIIALLFFLVPVNLDWAQSFDRSLIAYAILFAKEYAIGFVLGAIVSAIFWALQAAGDFIDNQRGTAIASSADPLRGEDSSSLGNLFTLAFTTYIFVSGSMLLLLGILYRSFMIWPVGKSFPVVSDAFPIFMLAIADDGMRLMFNIAAPIIAVMFVAEFSLAIVSRFAPQVQVFVLAMPIKSLIGVAMLTTYFSVFYPFADRRLNDLPKAEFRFYEILRQGEKLLRPVPTAPTQEDKR